MSNISKLAIKELKSDKKMFFTMALSIIIVMILINSVVTLTLSYQQYIVNVARSKGNWEVRFNNVKYEDVKYIENDKNIKQIAIVNDLGTSNKNYGEWFEQYLHVKAYDKNALENLSITLIEGSVPKNKNEILIKQGMNFKIGDTIETIINNKEVSFEVSGIIKETDFDEFDAKALRQVNGAIILLDRENLTDRTLLSVNAICNNISKIYETTNRIQEKVGTSIEYNQEILTYACVAEEDSDFQTSIIVAVRFINRNYYDI